MQAAVALYDEALEVAPDVMMDVLRTLRASFQDGTPIPDDVGERMGDYHENVCGGPVFLGSLD